MPEQKLTKQHELVIRRFLWSYVREQKGLLIGAVSASAFYAVSWVGISAITKKFLDQGLIARDPSASVKLSFALFGLLTLQALFGFTQRILTRVAAERAIRSLRNRAFSRLLAFSEATLTRYSSGMAVTRAVNDVQTIGVGIVQGSDIIRAPFMLIGCIGYLFHLNWQLTLTCFILFPLLAFVGDKLGKSARRNQRRLQQSIERISNHIVEAIKGLRLTHVFEQTHLLKREFEGKTQESYGHLIKLARIEESITPITKILGAFVGTIVIAFAAWLVSQGKMTPGAFITFIMTAGNLIDPFRVLNDFNVRYQQMAAAGDRVREVIEEPLDSIGVAQALRLSDSIGARIAVRPEKLDLVFNDVAFRYPQRAHSADARSNPFGQSQSEPSAYALRSVNLQLEAGKKIALVGRSGSGKTTLSLLAMRLIDPVAGSVKLGGQDARDWEIAEYRSHFSYVSQDVFLFNRSIRDNLLFARPGARDDEIWLALEKAHIAEFIKGMPRQLDTLVAFDGADFSGGEKQRLSLARAFLRNAPVLILDEATSQLDAFSESAVQSALRELVVNRSVIVIAHRLSTVKEMDEIAVFEQGMMVERGAPGALLKSESGPFFDLWAKQNLS